MLLGVSSSSESDSDDAETHHHRRKPSETGREETVEAGATSEAEGDTCTTGREETVVAGATSEAEGDTCTTEVDSTTEDDSQVNSQQVEEFTPSDAPQAEEVCDGEPQHLVEHTEFAIEMQNACVTRFRLRGTSPALQRHECRCFLDIRWFRAITDGIRIATAGVQWSIQGEMYTVLLVACLGYKSPVDTRKNKKSAKVEDTRPTQVIVQESVFDGQPLSFTNMLKIPAVLLFRDGGAYLQKWWTDDSIIHA